MDTNNQRDGKVYGIYWQCSVCIRIEESVLCGFQKDVCFDFFPAAFKNWRPLIWCFLDKTTPLKKISKLTFFDLVYFLILNFTCLFLVFFKAFLGEVVLLVFLYKYYEILVFFFAGCILFVILGFIFVCFSWYNVFSFLILVVFLLNVFYVLYFLGVLLSKKNPMNTTRSASIKVCSKKCAALSASKQKSVQH